MKRILVATIALASIQASFGAELQEIAAFPNRQITGVAVSKSGRVFVNFPYWSDDQGVIETKQSHPANKHELTRIDSRSGGFPAAEITIQPATSRSPFLGPITLRHRRAAAIFLLAATNCSLHSTLWKVDRAVLAGSRPHNATRR